MKNHIKTTLNLGVFASALGDVVTSRGGRGQVGRNHGSFSSSVK